MRGDDGRSGELFSYVDLEARVRAAHPLRPIREMRTRRWRGRPGTSWCFIRAFGWIKTVAGLRKTRFRGRERVDLAVTFAVAAYNLLRLPKLMAEAPP